MADKKYSALIELKDKFTQTMQKAIQQTQQLTKQLELADKQLDKLTKPRTVNIKFKLDSSFNSVKNTIDRALPTNKKIKVSANQDITSEMDKAKRDIFTMTNEINSTLDRAFAKMTNNLNATTSKMRASIGQMNSAMRSMGTMPFRSGSFGTGNFSRSLAGAATGSLAGNVVAGGLAGAALRRRQNTNQQDANNQDKNAKDSKIDLNPINAVKKSWAKSGATIDNAVNGIVNKWRTASNGVNVANALANRPPIVNPALAGMRDQVRTGMINGVPMMRGQKTAIQLQIKGLELIDKVKNKLRALSLGTKISVFVKDMATTGINKIKSKIAAIKRAVVNISLKNTALAGINKVKSALYSVVRTPFRIALTIKDMAMTIIKKVGSGLKSLVSHPWQTILKVKDTVGPVVSKVMGKLKSIGGKAWSIAIKGIDKVSGVISSIRGKLASLTKVAAAVTIGAAAGSIKEAATLEQQKIAMQHFIERFNNMSAGSGKEKTEKYVKDLALFSDNVPFETGEVVAAGQRGVQIANGNTDKGMDLVKLSADMAALNPGKSISDAMEALADLKNGETERMKEFGFKISQDQMKSLGGGDMNKAFDVLTGPTGDIGKLYGATAGDKGGAEKFGDSFKGIMSTIKGRFKTGLAFMGEPIIKAMEPSLQKVSAKMLEWVNVAPQVGANLVSGFTTAYGVIKPLVDSIINLFKHIGVTIKNAFKGTDFSKIGTTLKIAFADAAQFIDNFTGKIDFAKNGEQIGQSLSKAFEGAANTINNVLGKVNFTAYGEQAGKTIQTLFDTLGNLFNNTDFQSKFASITAGVVSFATAVQPIVQSLITTFGQIIPPIMDVVSAIMSALGPAVGYIGQAFQIAIPLIGNIIQTVCPIVEQIVGALGPVFTAIGEAVLAVVQAVQYAWPLISSIIQVAADIISPILSTIGSLASVIVDVFQVLWPPIVGIVSGIWDGLKPILEAISWVLDGIASAAKSVASWFDNLLGKSPQVEKAKSSVGSGSKDWGDNGDDGGKDLSAASSWGVDSSNAVGLNYVPRDGYISRLHEGEMVLTAQEADMYRNQNNQKILANRLSVSSRGAAVNNSSNSNVTIPAINIYGVQDPEQLADQIVPVITQRLGAKSTNAVPVF